MGKYKIYDRDFRVNAVKLGHETNFFKVSKDLGIATTNIYRWRDELRKDESKSFCGRTPEQRRFAGLKIGLNRKLKGIEIQIEIVKKAGKYISDGKPSIFHFIENNLDKYSLWRMCKVFGIIPSTYLNWKNKILSPRERRRITIENEILSIFYEYKEMYGNGKIAVELQKRGIQLGKCAVTCYMKRLGLVSKHSSRSKDTHSLKFIAHNPCIFPNILNRQFTVDETSQVWVSGFTSLETSEGVLFLTIIMDLFDRKIIGWNLSENLKIKETSIPAWDVAVSNRKTKEGLIFHSNRSCQYANKLFKRKLDSYKYIKQSMSRAGNHLDNVLPRSFFNSFKSEIANFNTLRNKKEVEEKFLKYIETTN